jgi:glycosyltransferase involved in cell wall biosynthesis
MKKKLLYVDNRSQYFVANRLALARVVRDRFADVHVITLSRRAQDIDSITAEGLLYHKLRRHDTGQSIVRLGLVALELAKVFKELKPDLIHFFTLKAMCVGSIALRLACTETTLITITGLGYTFTSNSLKAFLLRTVLRNIFPLFLKQKSQYFIFQNQDDLSFFHSSLCLPRERLHLIKGSGVDTNKYTVLPEKIGEPTVVLAARMLRDKGICEFVEAARQLKREGVRARFLLVGDIDPENPAGISTAQLMEWHHSGSVEWYGYCEDMLSLFANAHIVCLPSYREGLSKVLLEGAACGRPLVTTNTPGCRDVVRDEENGLLVPPGDSRALAEALLRLIKNAQLRESMGRQGRVLVENEFALDKVIHETCKIYERLLYA